MKINNYRNQEVKSVFKPQGDKLRKQVLLAVILISLIGLFKPDVHAAFSDDVNGLQPADATIPTVTTQTKALAVASTQTAPDRALNSNAVGDINHTSKKNGGQYLKANIGGKKFTAKILSVTNALYSTDITLSGATSVFHSINNYDYQQISIGFINFFGIGTYYGDDTPDTDFEFYYFHDTATLNQQWDTYIGGGSGSVTITSYNSAAGTAAGNFNVMVVNDDDPTQSMIITGTFSLQGEVLMGY